MDKKKKEKNILILEDDPVYRTLVYSILSQKFNTYSAEEPIEAFEMLKNKHIHLLVCDYKLPQMNGLQFLNKIRHKYPETEVIMISNAGDIDTVIGALRGGAADYLKKPFNAEDLWTSVERAFKFAEMNRHLTHERNKNAWLNQEMLRGTDIHMIGQSQVIREIKQQMKMVAETPDTSVLIVGESGTGKELVARGIHQMSQRKNELLSAVNMSAIPESLFESEFFGHKKGSFTGAFEDKTGWFEKTNKGTLFLDEIGEMEASLQVKLLRVIENKTFTKLGNQKAEHFDIRIISATNKSLDELRSDPSFRQDLFHRLATFIIHLPPLRERKEDLEDLTWYLLSHINEKLGKNITAIDPGVFEFFRDYNFPGNIRELRNLIERAVIMCPHDTLLPGHFHHIEPSHSSLDQILEKAPTFDLQTIEKHTIDRALKKTNYNKAEAARMLNLEWNALNRRIQKYNISCPK